MTGRREVVAALVVALAVVAVYWPSLGVGFYSDDYEWLGRMNPALEQPSWVFTVFYRDFNPLLHASFLADWVLGGTSAVAFHAQSIAIHALCAALLLLLLRRTGRGLLPAACAALVWALNPRISEAAIWPAARGHSLAALLVLAAFLCLTARRRRAGDVCALILFALALLAKEVALFPMALVPWLARPWRERLPLHGGVAALGALFVVFNVVFKPDLHTSPAPWTDLLLKVPFILLRPIGLGDFYPFNWLALAAVIGAFAAAAVAVRRNGDALAGLLWVAVCTVPLIPLDKLSSRYLYLMSAGYAVVACAVVPSLAERLRNPAVRRLAAGGALGGVALLVAANALDARREIEDYRILGEPYRRCAEALAPHAAALAPGESLVVVDAGPRDAVARLGRRIADRGHANKLIPYRPDAVDGLIALPDLLNASRRERGMLARPAVPDEAWPRRTVVWDGSEAREAPAAAATSAPRERVFAARWDAASTFPWRGPASAP